MSDLTKEQRDSFLELAQKYDSEVYELLSRNNPTEVKITSREDADILDRFSSKICDLVFRDYPDISGKDEDINADAEMLTYLISNILSDSGFET